MIEIHTVLGTIGAVGAAIVACLDVVSSQRGWPGWVVAAIFALAYALYRCPS